MLKLKLKFTWLEKATWLEKTLMLSMIGDKKEKGMAEGRDG